MAGARRPAKGRDMMRIFLTLMLVLGAALVQAQEQPDPRLIRAAGLRSRSALTQAEPQHRHVSKGFSLRAVR